MMEPLPLWRAKRAVSWYVETGPMENTTLGEEVRFPTRKQAKMAMRALESLRGRAGMYPLVLTSKEEPNRTFTEWNEE